jgi:hypothetical protein
VRLCPGDFVVLDRMSVQLLHESFQLSKEPSPVYASEVAGTFNEGELGFVLEIYEEGPPSEEEFAKLLTPYGIGWLNVYYLERAED